MRFMTITGLALLVSAPVLAQDEPARRAAVEVAARVPFEKAMKGAPYSAETVVEGVQTLADGNRINRKTTGRVYRDGEGRTRREEDVRVSAVGGSVNFSRSGTVISIVDPVAGFSYSLDPENKVAWRTSMSVGGAIMDKLEAAQTAERRVYEERVTAEGRREVGFRSVPMTDDEKQKAEAAAAERRAVAEKAVLPTLAPTPAAGAGGRGGGGGFARARSNENVALGPLERKTLEGVAVEGRKTTTIIPAGQVGNEQPITITSEEWRSPELNLLVLTRHSDPRTGESIYRLQNIIRAEPDRSLFMVPADYTVKETGIRRMLEASMKK